MQSTSIIDNKTHFFKLFETRIQELIIIREHFIFKSVHGIRIEFFTDFPKD